MKKFTFVIVIFASLMAGSCRETKTNSIDSTYENDLREIIISIKNKNFDKFSNRIKNRDDFIFAIKNITLPNLKEEGRKKIKKLMKENINKNVYKSKIEAKKAFSALLRDCRRYGVNLSKITYEIETVRMSRQMGLQMSDPSLRINDGKRAYILKLDLAKSDRGWVINFANNIQIRPDYN